MRRDIVIDGVPPAGVEGEPGRRALARRSCMSCLTTPASVSPTRGNAAAKARARRNVTVPEPFATLPRELHRSPANTKTAAHAEKRWLLAFPPWMACGKPAMQRQLDGPPGGRGLPAALLSHRATTTLVTNILVTNVWSRGCRDDGGCWA